MASSIARRIVGASGVSSSPAFNAVEFDGVDSRVLVPAVATIGPSDEYEYSFRIHSTSGSGLRAGLIIGGWNTGYGILLSGDNRILVYGRGSSTLTFYDPPGGVESVTMDIRVTTAAGTTRLYVNDVEVRSTTNAATSDLTNANVYIGSSNTQYYQTGFISNARLEVNGVLVFRLPMDDGADTSAVDQSGSGNDGALEGGATWGVMPGGLPPVEGLDLTPNDVDVVVAPYGISINTGVANFGNTGGVSRDYIVRRNQSRIRQPGSLKSVRLYFESVPTSFAVKVWRKNSAGTYDQAGTSAFNESLATGTNTYNLTTPVACLEGDYVGFEITNASDCMKSVAATSEMRYVAGAGTSGVDFDSGTLDGSVAVPIECYMVAPSIIFIGDSITEGRGRPAHDNIRGNDVVDPTDQAEYATIPFKAAEKLGDVTYQNMGIGSQKVDQVEARISADVLAYSPKAAVVMVGVNDAAAGSPIPKATYETEMESIVSQCLTNDPQVIPVVVKVTPISTTSASQMGFWEDYHDAIDEIAAANPSMIVVDAIEEIGAERSGGPANNNWDIRKDMDSSDGVHLSEFGHDRLAEYITAAIKDVIPTPLPTGGGVIAPPEIGILEAAWQVDAAYCWQDAGKTIPCTDGTACAAWESSHGQSIDFGQEGSQSLPTFVVENGQPRLRFDGHTMSMTFPVAIPQPGTIVMNLSGVNIKSAVLTDGSNPNKWLTLGGGNGIRINAGSTLQSDAIADDQPHSCWVFEYNGAASKMFQNGFRIPDNGATVGSNALLKLIIASTSSGALPLNGDITKIAVYSDVISGESRNAWYEAL